MATANLQGRRYTVNGAPVRLAEFLEANPEAPEEGGIDVAAIEALPVGGEINYGGGAGHIFTLRRVA